MEVTFAEEYSAIHKGLLHCLGLTQIMQYSFYFQKEFTVVKFSENYLLPLVVEPQLFQII